MKNGRWRRPGRPHRALIAEAANLSGVAPLVTLSPKSFRHARSQGAERIREP